MLPRNGNIIHRFFSSPFIHKIIHGYIVTSAYRFQMTSAAPDGSVVPMSQSIIMVDTFIPPYQLNPTMDIFAAGYDSVRIPLYYYYFAIFFYFCVRCSLIELFTEGQAPFDFAQLLAYRSQEMSTTPVLEMMEDSPVRVIIQNKKFFIFLYSLIILHNFYYRCRVGFIVEPTPTRTRQASLSR
jgi:hypothetical protein